MITSRSYPSVHRDLQTEIELGAVIVATKEIAAVLRSAGHVDAAAAVEAQVKAIIMRETATNANAATRAVLSIKPT